MEIEDASEKLSKISDRVAEVIVGKREVIDALITSFLSKGHVLLEGVPGIGKTMMARTFAQAIGGEFKRVQMTPDLLPADVTGTEIYREGSSFELKRGPIFSNVFLADELNRATPKVQSAFLEAMQERQVTIGGETMALQEPFMVMATQVSYGRSGTYPLTNVQIDRFAFRIPVNYPERGEEIEVLDRIDWIDDSEVEPAIKPEEGLELSNLARNVRVDEKIRSYIVDLISSLRKRDDVRTGPSPRASIWLFKGSRARALLEGRDYVIPDDVKELSHYTISHRMEFTAEAEAGEIEPRELIDEALEEVPVPKGIER